MSPGKDLEECILLIVGILGDNAYPARITDTLGQRAGRTVPVAAVHSILYSFEEEGVLVSSSKKIKGKPWSKRVYSITEYGRTSQNIPMFAETLNELLNLQNLHHSPRAMRF